MIHRIAVFRALQLGDMLVAVPALRALRARFPSAEITLIGLPWAVTFVQRYQHYLDRFVEFVGYPGLIEVPYDPKRTQRFIEQQHNYQYDLVLQLHGSGTASNPLIQQFQAAFTAGAYTDERVAGLTWGVPYTPDLHEIQRLLRVVELVGCDGSNPSLEFPLYAEDYAELETLMGILPQSARPLIALHPGARPPARRWPTAYFARVGDDLARRYQTQIILTGGPGEEEIVHSVISQMHTQALNLAGKTSLGGLAALISKLDLFVSNDTGPAHLACALDQPSITIFGPADYVRWAPLNQERHPVAYRPVACSPCGHWECPIDHRCLRGLSPDHVLSFADRLLARQRECL